MGDGDAWPAIREKMMAADILIVWTPTWAGHMSSVAQRVLERLDAELSETDAAGRPRVSGKVAVMAVVGNEDGAHKITADLLQGLNDFGFTIRRRALVLERGGHGHPRLPGPRQPPEAVASTTATLAENAAVLARALQGDALPKRAPTGLEERRRRRPRPVRGRAAALRRRSARRARATSNQHDDDDAVDLRRPLEPDQRRRRPRRRPTGCC